MYRNAPQPGVKMKLIGNPILTLALSTMLIASAPAPVDSCSCLSPPEPLEAMKRSDYVLAGVVIDREALGPSPHVASGDTFWIEKVRWEFSVTVVWKGPVQDTVYVYTTRSEASCGYEFEVGEHYLVYGQIIDKVPEMEAVLPAQDVWPFRGTSICTRTKEYDKATSDIFKLPAPLWSKRED